MKLQKNMPLNGEQKELVQQNLKLADFYANKWRYRRPDCKRFMTTDEIRQVARFGLIKAAIKWNPSRASFSTCAWHYVMGTLGAYYRKNFSIVKCPMWQQNYLTSLFPEPCMTLEERHEPIVDTPDGDYDDYYPLYHALQLLTDRQRTVIAAYYEEGLTYAKIGERLGCCRENIRVILNGALDLLAKELNETHLNPYQGTY